MTREEAIYLLNNLRSVAEGKEDEAIDMATESLSADTVPKGVMEQFKWERDVAMAQLEEYGIPFCTNKNDDIVEVVRCGECKHLHADGRCEDCRHWYKKMNKCNRCPSISGNWGANDFCSYGERRQNDKTRKT